MLHSFHAAFLHRSCDAEEILTQGGESRDFYRPWSELLCGSKSPEQRPSGEARHAGGHHKVSN